MAVNLFGRGSGGQGGGFDLSKLGADATTALTDAAGFFGLFPGPIGQALRDAMKDPFVQNLLRRQVGKAQSAAITEALPNLSRFTATGDVTSLTLPSGEQRGVSLPAIGTQRVSERFAEFDALTQMAAEQRAEIANFRAGVGDAEAGLREANRILQQAGISSFTQLRRGLQDVARLRQDTLTFMAAGLRRSDENIAEIQRGNEEVLANIDVDIAGRLASTRDGIEAAATALFNQVSRDLDSQSPMSPEERAGLRMAFNAQAATDTALALGSIHAEAVEFRGTVASQLQTSVNTARSFAIQSSSNLIAQGMSAFTQAETISADLRKTHMNDVKQLSIARSELKQFSAAFTIEADKILIDAVSAVERPVLVISDIMWDQWDDAFQVAAFNNGVLQQTFINKMAAISPELAATWAAIGGLDRATAPSGGDRSSGRATAGGAVSGAATGAIAGGTLAGPWGALAGGIAGGVGGGLIAS